uniref:Secreted protein n=1 Tax=Pyxicephalus adspersus TaxID=30357 RepID=A0AAV3AUH7_PYXAD|nr:TPA: hypothetical protein GDO54_008575 [Pyxicephalus adspersus]
MFFFFFGYCCSTSSLVKCSVSSAEKQRIGGCKIKGCNTMTNSICHLMLRSRINIDLGYIPVVQQECECIHTLQPSITDHNDCQRSLNG